MQQIPKSLISYGGQKRCGLALGLAFWLLLLFNFFSLNASAATLTATPCAQENTGCAVPTNTTAAVFYGAQDQYTILSNWSSGTKWCSTQAFGYDPIIGKPKSCAYLAYGTNGALPTGSIACSAENGTCTIPANTKAIVYFGAPNGTGGAQPISYKVKYPVTGSITCDVNTFGDPAQGSTKSCSYAALSVPENIVPPAFTGLPLTAPECAKDNSACVLPTNSKAAILYGSQDKFSILKYWSGSKWCSAAAFGVDPNPGVDKNCSYLPYGNNGELPTQAVYCGNENSTCIIPTNQKALVYFGALNGTGGVDPISYRIKYPVTGSIACNINTFGDPAPGLAKSCSYIVMTTSPPFTGTPVDAVACAQDNSACAVPTNTTATVFYGSQDKYAILSSWSSGTKWCSAQAFGFDPNPGISKSCSYLAYGANGALPTLAAACANENGACAVPANKKSIVYFGPANGPYRVKYPVTRTIACNINTFGDPAPGATKACSYMVMSVPDNIIPPPFTGQPANTTQCAQENSACAIPTNTTAVVFYGAQSNYAILNNWNSGTKWCSTQAFGFDPLPGVAKACSYLAYGPSGELPTGSVYCGNESSTCIIPGNQTAIVFYGATNGAGSSQPISYKVKYPVTGSVACNSNIFGDPAPGAAKSCSYLVLSSPTSPPAPDIAVTLTQPTPSLTATALSEIPVTVTNQGSVATNGSLTLTMTLPNGISAPPKFARNADAWVCLNPANTITCTYSKNLGSGASTMVRLPITPAANTVGTAPGPFVANIAATTGELNTVNNTSPALSLNAAVASLNLPSVPDPNYSTPVLDPTVIPKYTLPLPNAFASYFRHTPNTTSASGTDSYTLDIKQVNTNILPPGFPATPVFAYGDPARPDTFTYPAHTIVAHSTDSGLNSLGLGKPVKVKYLDTRTNTSHLLPVDHSIHGAMANEPDVRSIAHLHGIQQINQNSDGFPESWISPNGQNGQQFSVIANTVPINPNPVDYGNNQESALLWYHDHSLGITRLNVYSGLAGLYLLRDSNEQTMINNNSLPNGAYELPLVIQDRMFHTDGSLAYPDLNPEVPTSPALSLLPEFFGNVMVVNGAAWPFQEVEPRRYRFRVLNGSGSRFYTLALSNNASFQIIGTEGGFLAAPTTVSSLTIAPAERYDVIIDFSTMNGQTITLTNSAKTPFPNGADIIPGLDDQIMQFRVNLPLSSVPNNPLPSSLRPGGVPVITPTVTTPRQVLLSELVDNYGRILPIIGTVAAGPLGWMDPVSETPAAGTVETWEIYNNTQDAHPIHLHGGHFQVVNRQPFSATEGPNLGLTAITYPGAAVLPAAAEKTWKDTVISYPGEVTRINVKVSNAGMFVWHCHILEHEDHDMMRPMLVQ